MNIAICDDEQLYVDKIASYITTKSKKHSIECNFFKCNRGDTLIELCKKKKIDVIFLDIAMPGIDGFETAEQLLNSRKNIILVFVSSNESLVFNSYEYKPLWFVPKSKMELLEIVMDKIFEKIENEKNEDSLITINIETNKVIEINLQNIAYFKTDDHYIQIISKDKKISNSYRNKIENIEKQLSKHWFVRTHNRYFINCRMISVIEKNSCILINGEQIPISRTKMTQTKEVFQSYLRSLR